MVALLDGGGTGVVALPQILAHRDPYGSLRISTPKRDQLRVPIDVLLSCREDDAPLAPRAAATVTHVLRTRFLALAFPLA